MNGMIHGLPNTYVLNRDWCVTQPRSLGSLEKMAQLSFLRASPPVWHRWPLIRCPHYLHCLTVLLREGLGLLLYF